jgi:uncharacterized repeat protein (TIGR02543 family)
MNNKGGSSSRLKILFTTAAILTLVVISGTPAYAAESEAADMLRETACSGTTFYTVSFEENGGSAIKGQRVAAGGVMTLPATPERPGYTFADWFVDSDCTIYPSFMAPINQDTTLYAKWYVRVATDPVAADNQALSGFGQPFFRIEATLPDGTRLEGYAEEDGTWSLALPDGASICLGDIIHVAMFNPIGEEGQVSYEDVAVSDSMGIPDTDKTPDTGDPVMILTICLFGMFLGVMIMIGVVKGPRTYK